MPDHAETKPVEHFDIHIDRKPYTVSQTHMTGLQLRELAGLDASVDLYREEQGDVEDTLIGDGESIALKAGQHFYSTPKNITPGRG